MNFIPDQLIISSNNLNTKLGLNQKPEIELIFTSFSKGFSPSHTINGKFVRAKPQGSITSSAYIRLLNYYNSNNYQTIKSYTINYSQNIDNVRIRKTSDSNGVSWMKKTLYFDMSDDYKDWESQYYIQFKFNTEENIPEPVNFRPDNVRLKHRTSIPIYNRELKIAQIDITYVTTDAVEINNQLSKIGKVDENIVNIVKHVKSEYELEMEIYNLDGNSKNIINQEINKLYSMLIDSEYIYNSYQYNDIVKYVNKTLNPNNNNKYQMDSYCEYCGLL